MVQGLVRLTLLAVLLLSGCAVTPPAEKAEPVTADTELQGSPAMALLSRAEQALLSACRGISKPIKRALSPGAEPSSGPSRPELSRRSEVVAAGMRCGKA